MLDWLFGTSKRRKKASKKSSEKKKKTTKKSSKTKGLKHFIVFDKYSNKKIAEISGKSEGGAWKAFISKSNYEDKDSLRVISKRRWESEQ